MWSTYLTFMKHTFTAAEELPEQGQRAFLTVLQAEEVAEIADFERNWGLSSLNLKTKCLSIENNALLWAKQIFKTKPNHEVRN
jgi:hypothetical protein